MAGTRQIPEVTNSTSTCAGEARVLLVFDPLAGMVAGALSGILQVLVFPMPNLNWLCWIALTPLLVAILHARRIGRVPSSVASVRQGAHARVRKRRDPLPGFV